MNVEMMIAVALPTLVVLVLFLRGLARRVRCMRRLDRALEDVAKAMADGRIPNATGEALMQHLDGLRRRCVRGRGG
jgi:hypothetical protein